MWFLNPSKGFVVGDAGTIRKTFNRGISWQDVDSGTTADLNCIYFVNNYLGYIGAQDGTILIAVDGGSSWHRAVNPPDGLIDSITMTPQGLIAVGMHGSAFISDMDGMNWYRIPVKQVMAPLSSVTTGPGGSAWAVTLSGKILMSNGFSGFLTQVPSPLLGRPLYSIQFKDDIGFIAGGSGLLARTLDGGLTWQSIDTLSGAELRSVQIVSPEFIVAIGS